jgi:hypothetical protein
MLQQHKLIYVLIQINIFIINIMNRTDLNDNFIPTILYHCFVITGLFNYNITAIDVGEWGYDEYSNLYIVSWFLLNPTQPSIEDLLTYTVSNVTNFYNSYYSLPDDIKNSQPFNRLTQTQIDSIPTAKLVSGYLIYNTTSSYVQIWSGSAWVNI